MAISGTSRNSSRKGLYGFGIKLAVGVSLIGLLLWRYDLRSSFSVIWHERPLMFAASVTLFITVQLVSALRWQLLARINGIGGRYREYLAYYFIGMFTNVFVPGLVGGDALRAVYLGRRHDRVSEAVASVVLDRGVGLLTLFWFAGLASLFISTVQLPASVIRVTLAAAALSLGGYLLAPWIIKSSLGIPRLNALLAPLRPYLCRPAVLVPAIALSAFLQFSFAVCQYLLGRGLGLEVQLATFVLVVPITNVIASLPVSINGLGLREASYLVLLGMVGVSKDKAVALSILYFAATLVAGFTGILPFILTPIPGIQQEIGDMEPESREVAS